MNNNSNKNIVKIYQVINEDPIWDNWEELGWFRDLKDAAPVLRPYIIDCLVLAINDGMKIISTSDGSDLQLPDDVGSWEYLLDQLVVVPDTFLMEYPSTSSTIFDRPFIDPTNLVSECLPGYIVESDSYNDFNNECCLSILGFIHYWPEDAVNAVLEFQEDINK